MQTHVAGSASVVSGEGLDAVFAVAQHTVIAAFQWMRQAAMRGNVVAQSRLARMFAEGIGVQRDRIEAAKWHIVARRAGLTDAWLDEFLVGLPKKDFSTALSRANSWRGS